MLTSDCRVFDEEVGIGATEYQVESPVNTRHFGADIASIRGNALKDVGRC